MPYPLSIVVATLLAIALSVFSTARGETPPDPDRMVMAHFMSAASVGAECGPGEGPLMSAPSQPNGVMALFLPEFLTHYRQP